MNKKINIVFHNPQAIWFKTNLSCYFAKTRSISKYDFLFDYVYNSNETIKVLIDKSSSSPLFRTSLHFINNPVLDFYAWVLLNRLKISKFKVIASPNNLNKNDILFSFLYGTYTHVDVNNININTPFLNTISHSNAFKVVHLTHYGYNTKLGSKNSQLAGIDLFVGENNLFKNSSFFNHFFTWYKKDVLVLPYVPQKRFVSKIEFSKRIGKALSTGTLTHKIVDPDFNNFFNSDILQPMRSSISLNAKNLEPYLDSLISNIQTAQNITKDGSNSNFVHFLKFIEKGFKYIFGDLWRLFSLLYKYIFNESFNSLKNENKYYKLDIVESYNRYKMFIVPEEVIGMPGIGFVEGMTCGCAYIGLNDPMYKDIGMVDGVHYIGYDGTLENLISKISYYQEHDDELRTIAESGCEFVNNNFNGEKVAQDFCLKVFDLANFKRTMND